MTAARTPIRFDDLSAHLLGTTPGATVEQVAKLLDRLCEQALLLTDLRPPLTVASPARYVLEKLDSIPAAAQHRALLASVVEAAGRWDAEPSPDEAGFRALDASAKDAVTTESTALQVDSALGFTSSHPVEAHRQRRRPRGGVDASHESHRARACAVGSLPARVRASLRRAS